MIMVRELTKEEIELLGQKYNPNEYCTDFDYEGFAKALFEAARVQQTAERVNGQG